MQEFPQALQEFVQEPPLPQELHGRIQEPSPQEIRGWIQGFPQVLQPFPQVPQLFPQVPQPFPQATLL